MAPGPTSLPLSPRSSLAAAVVFALGAFALGHCLGAPKAPLAAPSTVEVAPSPDVIVAVRELARLETTGFHIERVIELADSQSRFFGLLNAKDALLLVAAGDVVAGIDLAKLDPSSVSVDWPNRTVRLDLPKAEIFSVAIDNARTHVVTRNTDVLADRVEALEGRARLEAETSMRQGALEAGVLAKAQAGGERAVRELLKGLGFRMIDVS